MLFNSFNTPSLQSSYEKIEFLSHICEKHHRELPASVIITFLTFGGLFVELEQKRLRQKTFFRHPENYKKN